jgi:hypothetical protein
VAVLVDFGMSLLERGDAPDAVAPVFVKRVGIEAGVDHGDPDAASGDPVSMELGGSQNARDLFRQPDVVLLDQWRYR